MTPPGGSGPGKKLWLVAGAAVVAAGVTVAAVAIAMRGDSSGQASEAAGGASSSTQPAGVPADTTTSAGLAPGLNREVLAQLLLPVEDLNAALGAVLEIDGRGTELVEGTADRSLRGGKPVNDCGTAPTPGLRVDGYEGAGVTGVEFQSAVDRGRGSRAIQVLTTFRDEQKAQEFFAAQSEMWEKCAKGGWEIRLTAPGGATTGWFPGPAEKDMPDVLSISLHTFPEEGRGTLNCHHSLAVRRNIGIDIQTCGYYDEGLQAPALAAKIAERIPSAK